MTQVVQRSILTKLTGEGWPFGDLEKQAYGAILVDPPWEYKMRSDKGYERSPQAHYDCMPTEEIAKIPVGELGAKDSILFMWALWTMPRDAMVLFDAWGYEPLTGGAWFKTTKRNRLAMGTGYRFRGCCEPFYIGVRGSPETTGNKDVLNAIGDDSFFTDDEMETIAADGLSFNNVIWSLRRMHSQKPPDQYQLIERAFVGPYVEVFAGAPRRGWDCVGNDAAGRVKHRARKQKQSAAKKRTDAAGGPLLLF